MKHEKINCSECNKLITTNNLKNHIGSKSCKQNKLEPTKEKITVIEEWKQPNNKYKCPHCNIEYSKNGLPTHIWRMHGDGQNHNPNLGYKYENGREAWNKGLTKETDKRVKKNAIAVSKTFQKQIKNGTYTAMGTMSLEARQRLSERQSINNSGGRSKWFEIDGVYVQGTWERDCVLKFNELGIEWKKVKKEGIIKYSMNESIKSYTPDIFLPEFGLTLEIKGYWWGNDEEKMKCVLESNSHLGDKIYFVFENEFNKIKRAESKSELITIIGDLKSLKSYYE